MKIHELKTIDPYFYAIKFGIKRFELRNNDRDFKIGDILHLRQYEYGRDGIDFYRGDECIVRVKEVFKDFKGLEDGYCILSISDPL